MRYLFNEEDIKKVVDMYININNNLSKYREVLILNLINPNMILINENNIDYFIENIKNNQKVSENEKNIMIDISTLDKINIYIDDLFNYINNYEKSINDNTLKIFNKNYLIYKGIEHYLKEINNNYNLEKERVKVCQI